MATTDRPLHHSTSPEFEPLRWIGAYKLFKALLALVGGLLVLRLMHRDLPEIAQRWMTELGIDPAGRIGHFLLRKVIAIHAGHIKWMAVILFAYTPITVAEGVGLMLRKVWAEWLTVITTCALIPVEVGEFVRRPTWVRILILLLNVAVVIYLIVRIRRDRGKHATDASRPQLLPRESAAAEEQSRGCQSQHRQG